MTRSTRQTDTLEASHPLRLPGQLRSFWCHGQDPHPGDRSSGLLSFIPLSFSIFGDKSFHCPGLVLCTLLLKRPRLPQSHAPRTHQILLITNSCISSIILVSCVSLTNHHLLYVQLIPSDHQATIHWSCLFFSPPMSSLAS